MFKVAVVDDSQEMTEIVRGIVKSQAEASGMEQEIMIKTYTVPEALLDDLKDEKYFHIYILDVEMPDMSGIVLADSDLLSGFCRTWIRAGNLPVYIKK